MHHRNALVCALSLVALLAPAASAQDEMDPAAMQEWMEFTMPGPEHAMLAEMVGEWSLKTKLWLIPGAPPTENEASLVIRPMIDGRYFVEHLHGSIDMGTGEPMPFEGINLFGFDRVKGKHFFVWADNFGTGVLIGEGDASPDGKTITYYSEGFDPMAGVMKQMKSVSTFLGHDRHTLDMYEKAPGGEWRQTFQGVYTRTH